VSRRHPTDWSLDDLVTRLCVVCDVNAAQLADPDVFPGPDYRDELGACFWREGNVRAWVEAHAWTEVLTRRSVLEQLVQQLQARRRLALEEPLPPAVARVQALHDFVNAKLARVFR
jgi:hypothetical protein